MVTQSVLVVRPKRPTHREISAFDRGMCGLIQVTQD
jgi:hypothetical protein